MGDRQTVLVEGASSHQTIAMLSDALFAGWVQRPRQTDRPNDFDTAVSLKGLTLTEPERAISQAAPRRSLPLVCRLSLPNRHSSLAPKSAQPNTARKGWMRGGLA